MESRKWNMTDNIYKLNISIGTIGIDNSKPKSTALKIGDVVMVSNFGREIIGIDNGRRGKVVSISTLVEVDCLGDGSKGCFFNKKSIKKMINGKFTFNY